MATHIRTIVDCQYVTLCDSSLNPIKPFNPKTRGKNLKSKLKKNSEKLTENSRQLIPTPLGVALIEGFMKVNPELVLPGIRALMEQEVGRIADGTRAKNEVLDKELNGFKRRYDSFKREERQVESVFKSTLKPMRQHLAKLKTHFRS